MWRLLVGGIVIAVMLWPRPAAAQEECPVDAATPEETAGVLYGQYLAGGQWDMAYDTLHPEAQIRLAFPVFASMAQTEAVLGPLVDVQVLPAQASPGWTWGLTGLRFTNVAEVPVRYTVGTPAGPVTTAKVVALAQVGNCWRWLPALQ